MAEVTLGAWPDNFDGLKPPLQPAWRQPQRLKVGLAWATWPRGRNHTMDMTDGQLSAARGRAGRLYRATGRRCRGADSPDMATGGGMRLVSSASRLDMRLKNNHDLSNTSAGRRQPTRVLDPFHAGRKLVTVGGGAESRRRRVGWAPTDGCRLRRRSGIPSTSPTADSPVQRTSGYCGGGDFALKALMCPRRP